MITAFNFLYLDLTGSIPFDLFLSLMIWSGIIAGVFRGVTQLLRDYLKYGL